MPQGSFPVFLRPWVFEGHSQVKCQPLPFLQVHQREPLKPAFQHGRERGCDVTEVELEKLPLGVVQRGVPRGGAAHDTVLRGFAVDVAHFDFEEGDLGVGVVPDANLEPGSLASDVLPNTNVVGRVEVEVAVRRGHRVCDCQQRLVLQLCQRVAQPMFRHQELRIVTVHQGTDSMSSNPKWGRPFSRFQRCMQVSRR